ncbi:MAG: RDD family protein [archaeon]
MAGAVGSSKYVGFWARVGAAGWDGLIIGLPVGLVQQGVSIASVMLDISSLRYLVYLISLAVIVFIVYMEGVKGGTPGKIIMGMRIQKEGGQLIGVPTAILRYIGKIISGLILGIGHFMIAWDPKKQGLHDKIASSFVVYKKPKSTAMQVIGIILFFLPVVIVIGLLVVGLMFMGAIFSSGVAGLPNI